MERPHSDPPQGRELGLHRLWSHPFTPQVRGQLRGQINQYSDPAQNTLTPKKPPTSQRRTGDFRVLPLSPEINPDPGPPPVCVPPNPTGTISQTGGSTPLAIGENVVFSEDGTTGSTTPITYQWFLNSTPTDTTATFPYTVADEDIMDKDESGLGVIEVSVVVNNACGTATYTQSFSAQGTAPPACVPPDPAGFIFSDIPPTWAVGFEVVLSETASSGASTPLNYQWFLNGSPTVTTATYPYTVADGDIQDKDEFGFGVIRFAVAVSNACGMVTLTASFAAEGTPPP